MQRSFLAGSLNHQAWDAFDFSSLDHGTSLGQVATHERTACIGIGPRSLCTRCTSGRGSCSRGQCMMGIVAVTRCMEREVLAVDVPAIFVGRIQGQTRLMGGPGIITTHGSSTRVKGSLFISNPCPIIPLIPSLFVLHHPPSHQSLILDRIRLFVAQVAHTSYTTFFQIKSSLPPSASSRVDHSTRVADLVACETTPRDTPDLALIHPLRFPR